VLSIDVDDRTAGITIHELQPHGSRTIGTFADAASAWAAVDELDAPAALRESEAVSATPVRRPTARDRRSRSRLSGALRRPLRRRAADVAA
jgi:hypothetical protein